MILETIAVGALAVNCYIVGSEATHEAAVIDPGDDADRITSALHRRGLKLKYIIWTDAHFDHAGAAKELFEKTFASVMVHEKDAALLKNMSVQAAFFGMHVEEPPRPDIFLKGGDKIKIGDIEMEVIETPGHTPVHRRPRCTRWASTTFSAARASTLRETRSFFRGTPRRAFMGGRFSKAASRKSTWRISGAS